MKFFHLADLHIGKRVCEHSMLDDQKYVLAEIIEAVVSERPDGVLIAGDVYDKSVPSAEAVAVLDDFLVKLSETGTQVFVISGNHDSAERIAFGGRLMENRGVYMSPVYDGVFTSVTLKDEFGEVDVWMLPFVRPGDVRAAESADFAGAVESGVEKSGAVESGTAPGIANFTDAIRVALSHARFTSGRRNVLVAHQFVTGAEVDRDGSEENVGGLDNVDASVFEAFDYVALGHIHRPQDVVRNAAGVGCVRYSGTPLKYSLSEATQNKSITVVELGASHAGPGPAGCADLNIREIPLVPLHDVRKIRGTFADLVSAGFRDQEVHAGRSLEDYVYVELTDENDIPDAAVKLRGYYPNLMSLAYDNSRTRSAAHFDFEKVDQKTPEQVFSDFFKEMNNRPMEEDEENFVNDLIKSIWEGI